MKGIKTTVTAFIFLFELLSLIVAMVMKVITFDELKNILAVSTPVFVLAIGWFSRDEKEIKSKK